MVFTLRLFWKSHCYVLHNQDSKILCDVTGHIRTLTDRNGKELKFIMGVLYTDGTFHVLDEKDYQKECDWWSKKESKVNHNSFITQKRTLEIKDISTKDKLSEIVRDIVRIKYLDPVIKNLLATNNDTSYVSSIFGGSMDKSILVDKIENAFFNYAVEHNYTIYDYVISILTLIIFMDANSLVGKYTKSFRSRIASDYFQAEILPTLELVDLFPELICSKNEQHIARIKKFIKQYVSIQADDLMSLAAIRYDQTLKRDNPPNPDDMILKDAQTRRELKMIQSSAIPDLEELKKSENCCVNKDQLNNKDIQNVLIYKDPITNVNYCFTIGDLLNRTSDINPHNPPSMISKEFLQKFEKEFGHLKSRFNQLRTTKNNSPVQSLILPSNNGTQSLTDLRQPGTQSTGSYNRISTTEISPNRTVSTTCNTTVSTTEISPNRAISTISTS